MLITSSEVMTPGQLVVLVHDGERLQIVLIKQLRNFVFLDALMG